MRSALLGIALICAASNALGEGVTVTNERRDLFVSILEANDCRMHNFYPSDGIMKAIEDNDFDRDEVRAIGRQLMDNGTAERNGDFLVLKTESCT